VVGFEGFYEVSDMGRVRSLDRMTVIQGRWGVMKRFQRGCLLKPLLHTGGYKRVTFWKGGQFRNAFIHILVLEAFVGPRPFHMEACHGDGSKDNNRLSNLRWATAKENQADREAHGTGRIGKGSLIRSRINPELAKQMREHHIAAGLSITELAKRFQLPRTTVADVINGRTWKRIA